MNVATVFIEAKIVSFGIDDNILVLGLATLECESLMYIDGHLEDHLKASLQTEMENVFSREASNSIIRN